jgi:hypothetical protein
MAALLAVLLVLAVTVAFGFVLYWLVRAEHERVERMDREAAERVARRDLDDDR